MPEPKALRGWATMWLSRYGCVVHQRTDPACAFYMRPKPGSQLDIRSRGLMCPRCCRRKVIR